MSLKNLSGKREIYCDVVSFLVYCLWGKLSVHRCSKTCVGFFLYIYIFCFGKETRNCMSCCCNNATICFVALHRLPHRCSVFPLSPLELLGCRPRSDSLPWLILMRLNWSRGLVRISWQRWGLISNLHHSMNNLTRLFTCWFSGGNSRTHPCNSDWGDIDSFGFLSLVGP